MKANKSCLNWRLLLTLAVLLGIFIGFYYCCKSNFLKVSSITDVSNTVSGVAPATSQKITNKQREALVNDLIEGTNQPINFLGKILDQDGNPIDAVQINYGWTTEHGNKFGTPWSLTKSHDGSTVSDADGTFLITGLSGHLFSIHTIVKQGYRPSNSFGFEGKGEIEYNFDKNDYTHFTYNKNKPVILYMIHEAAISELIVHGVPDELIYRLPVDGTSVFWNPWTGKKDAKGELKITFKREPAVLLNGQHPTNWEAKLEIVGGGIVESLNQKLFLAPESGYKSAIDYPKFEQVIGQPEQNFYFHTATDNYGRLEIEITPDIEGSSSRCYIRSYLNPNAGNRNLEYDKAKKVQK